MGSLQHRHTSSIVPRRVVKRMETYDQAFGARAIALSIGKLPSNYRKHQGEDLMQSALRIETKVLPDNKIEINLPWLSSS